jgi:phosphoglycolate phosphatase
LLPAEQRLYLSSSVYFCSMKNKENNTYPPAKAIIWDWNGTLLNDIGMCVDSINELLAARKLKTLNYFSYRDVFGFPVKDYYEKVGFDFTKEPFDVVALEFIDVYRSRIDECDIFNEVPEMLSGLAETGLTQYVLSAMQQEMLEESLKMKGVYHYFDLITGTSDHFANNKFAAAQMLQSKIDLLPKEVIMVGDTIHDFEVANAMGWRTVLIANGHQSAERLKKTGCKVLNSLIEIPGFLNNGHTNPH